MSLLDDLADRGLMFRMANDGGLTVRAKAAISPALRAWLDRNRARIAAEMKNAPEMAIALYCEYEERAAALEYDCGLSRPVAERRAWREAMACVFP